MLNPFTAHPKSIGESYLEHCYHASKFAIRMLIGGMACLIHAFIPCLFEKTASNYLFEMTENMINRMSGTEERIERLSQCLVQKKI